MYKNHKVDCQCSVCKAIRGESKGINSPMYGKHLSEEAKRKFNFRGAHHTEEAKRKIGLKSKGRIPWIKGKHHSNEARRKIGLASKGENNTNYGKHLSEEAKRKMSEKAKKRWQNLDYRERTLKAIFKGQEIKPTKPEKQLNEILQQLFPNEYKYVGDGSVIIGYKNPDFININGQKKIIELYGDYWHKPKEEQQRIKHFSRYGYQTLIIWEHELNDLDKLKEKLLDFC